MVSAIEKKRGGSDSNPWSTTSFLIRRGSWPCATRIEDSPCMFMRTNWKRLMVVARGSPARPSARRPPLGEAPLALAHLLGGELAPLPLLVALLGDAVQVHVNDRADRYSLEVVEVERAGRGKRLERT